VLTVRRGRGVCRSGATARVASWHPHFGEERPLVGSSGSGTIFFSRCNLLCVYCQNWEISHAGQGHDVTNAELAAMMLALQSRGSHNINL
jgi:putative pyruvate formate lyase activating enzyme